MVGDSIKVIIGADFRDGALENVVHGKYSLLRGLNQPFEAFCGEYSICSRAVAILVLINGNIR